MKPIAFIASTSEGRPFAEALQKRLKAICRCRRWDQGVFEAGRSQQESLLSGISSADFVIVVMTADDKVRTRGKEFFSPRDNLVFEAGMSFGANDPGRTLLVPERNSNFKLPSDLNGFTTTAPFDASAPPSTAMNEVAAEIRDRVRDLGIRPKSGIKLPKKELIKFSVELVRSASRNILMFGRDLSWADEYHQALEEMIAQTVQVEIFCEAPTNAPWQANVDRLVAAGAEVKFLPNDLGLRLTMVDTHDVNLCRFALMSKQRRAHGVRRGAGQEFTYACDMHDALNSGVLWQTLMKLYHAIQAQPANPLAATP